MTTFADESARLMGEYSRLMQEAAQGMTRALASQQEAMTALAERVALLEAAQDKSAEALRLLLPEDEAGED